MLGGKRIPRTPPRVLFAIGGLGTGGSEVQLVELLTRAHPHRIEAVLVTFMPGPPGPRLDRVRAAGIEHHVVGVAGGGLAVKALRYTARLRRVVRAVAPDLVYAWLEESAMMLVPVARLQGIPAAVARRNVAGSLSEQRALLRRLILATEARAGLVTANSEAVRRRAVERGIRPERLLTIPNGHARAEPLPLPGGAEVTLGYLSAVRHGKGHHRLLEVLERLPAEPRWRVLIAGDGPMEAEVRAAAARSPFADRIEFTGLVNDVPAFWARCDVGVLLSDSEGLPNALIEAAFAGRPLIGTDSGGTHEVIADGAGFLVDPADPAAAAATLARVIADPALRAACGRRAATLANERFPMQAMVDGHVAAIHSALARAAR